MSFRPPDRLQDPREASNIPGRTSNFSTNTFSYSFHIWWDHIGPPGSGSETLPDLIPTSLNLFSSGWRDWFYFKSQIPVHYWPNKDTIPHLSHVQKVLERKNQIAKKRKYLPSPLFPNCNLVVSSFSYRDQPTDEALFYFSWVFLFIFSRIHTHKTRQIYNGRLSQ